MTKNSCKTWCTRSRVPFDCAGTRKYCLNGLKKYPCLLFVTSKGRYGCRSCRSVMTLVSVVASTLYAANRRNAERSQSVHEISVRSCGSLTGQGLWYFHFPTLIIPGPQVELKDADARILYEDICSSRFILIERCPIPQHLNIPPSLMITIPQSSTFLTNQTQS